MKLIARPIANAVAVPRLLLRELGVKVSGESLKEKLEEHPDFPSLMAVADCFEEWNISNLAYRIPKEKYKPEDLQFPFIAQLPSNGGQFILVHRIEKGSVIYSDEQSNKKNITEEEFLQRWSGILLYAEASKDSGEKGYLTKRILGIVTDLKVPFLALILLALLTFSTDFKTATILYVSLSFLKILGIGISVLLLMHNINANNPLVQNLCSFGKTNDCNAILKSDAAKATSWLSWSEVGFFYFTGSFLSLLIAPSSVYLIMLLNLFALPYTIWSIYYQHTRKNWCVLCCAVQVVLWLEFLLALAANKWNADFLSLSLYVGIILSFLTPILLWYSLKPILQKTAEHKLLKQQLKKFKYNNDFFTHALTNQARYAIPEEIAPIIIGNPRAATVITMISNPFCNPCATAHQVLDKWLKTREDIQLKVVFTTADKDDDQKTKMARHMTALSLTKNVELVKKALNQWYLQREKKYDDWAKNYEVEIGQEVYEATRKQRQWCDLLGVTATPTILVNGYKLPKPYKLEDIQHLIN